MSHFTVTIIGPDPEGQLAPFDEGLTVPAYPRRIEPPYWWDRAASTPAEGLAAYPYQDESPVLMDDAGLYEVSTYNPRSKWDWYSLGGRWAGGLVLLDGSTTDQALRGSIDLAASPALPSFALLADGAWCEKGAMGWFGMDDATDESEAAYFRMFDAILPNLSPDTLISLYDLHI